MKVRATNDFRLLRLLRLSTITTFATIDYPGANRYPSEFAPGFLRGFLQENFSDVDIERLFCFVLSAFRAWVLVLVVALLVFFPPVGAGVPWRRGGGCWCSCRGLFVFLPIICGLHVAVFGVSSYYMEKFKPGGGWCSREAWCSFILLGLVFGFC